MKATIIKVDGCENCPFCANGEFYTSACSGDDCRLKEIKVILVALRETCTDALQNAIKGEDQ